MKILLRFDDITPYMEPNKWERVLGIVQKYDIRPILGVVPDCRDEKLMVDCSVNGPERNIEANPEFKANADTSDSPDILPVGNNIDSIDNNNSRTSTFFSRMRELEAGGYTIAQHGTTHIYDTDSSGLLHINSFSEYAGLEYEVQLEKLQRGRDILVSNGLNPKLFMAPGHTFDSNTLRALRELGFNAVTDGLTAAPYIREGLLHVPCRLTGYDRVKGIDTICLHPNMMEDEDFAELESFIGSHKEDFISYDYDSLIKLAHNYSLADRITEARTILARNARNKIAGSKRIAWYMSYTNAENTAKKWAKRLICMPLLLTNKYRDN